MLPRAARTLVLDVAPLTRIPQSAVIRFAWRYHLRNVRKSAEAHGGRKLTALEGGGPLVDLVAESQRVLTTATKMNVVVRLAGGLAIRHLCPAASTAPLSRRYADLDLAVAGHAAQRPLHELMAYLGYQPDAMFNALNEGNRLYFNDSAQGRHVDVFVDAVRMCHVIEFKHRLLLLGETLTPTDLLLTKLQIVELNTKDVLDVVALLHDQRVEAGVDAAIDTAYLEAIWSNDWPLWRTSQLTLQKIRRAVPALLDEEASLRVLGSLTEIERVVESGRKGLRWRLRSRVGERVRWYEMPEDIE